MVGRRPASAPRSIVARTSGSDDFAEQSDTLPSLESPFAGLDDIALPEIAADLVLSSPPPPPDGRTQDDPKRRRPKKLPEVLNTLLLSGAGP